MYPRAGIPRAMMFDNDWATLGSSRLRLCDTKTDGSLWCWGVGQGGKLGHGNASRVSPTITLS